MIIMEDDYWLVADYFDDFACKCGECRHTCCGGWKIAVGEDEYFRMIGMECSEELHHKIEGAFVRPDFPTHERYMLMEADWTGRCRMLGEDGLCMLQRECGEDAITEVCRVYPRSYKSENGLLNACCSGSCEAVVERLLRREPLRFRRESEVQMSHGHAVRAEITGRVDYDLAGLFDKVVTMLQDRSKPLVDRIAAIAGSFGEQTGQTAGSGLKSMVARHGAYGTLIPILREFCEEAPSFEQYVDEFEKRYSADNWEERFAADRSAFEERFPDWSCYFENLLCNNMLYAAFPAVDSRVDPYKAVHGLSLEYTLLRVMSICHTAVWAESNPDAAGHTDRCLSAGMTESLVDVIAEVYHVVEHTAFYYNALVLLTGDTRRREDTGDGL